MKKICFLIILLFCLGNGTINAQYKDLLDFNNSSYPQGAEPFGSVTLLGNRLYGMAQYGGATGNGCVFSVNTDGSGYKDLFDFNGTNGGSPWGTLILSGNKFYGMTQYGGTYNIGTIFSIDTNGNGYRILLSFTGYPTAGGYPYGSLLLLGNKFFGMTSSAGASNDGCVFSVDTNGSDYKELVDFRDMVSPYGLEPIGSLVTSGGQLFGMTWRGGGSHNEGCIFSVDTNGSSYKDLLNFSGLNGADPKGDLIVFGKVLYGMCEAGGLNGGGCVFSIDTNGIGYRDLYDFNAASGSGPSGNLSFFGNRFYGMADIGGINNSGVVFSIDTNGTGYQVLDYFKGGADGSYPFGSLAVSGNALYGMTADSGANGHGIIFGYTVITLTTVYNNVTCNGDNDGNAKVTPSGGTAPYTYLWAPMGVTSAMVSGLTVGCYTVTVNDAHGFSTSTNVCITQPLILSATIRVSNSVSCNGGSNGRDSVSVIGGTSPYTYLWSDANSQTTITATGLSAGTYSVNIQDNNGCTTIASCVVTQPTVLNANTVIIQNVSCNGSNNGIDSIIINGGVSPYTYQWSDVNSQTTIAASHLSAGIYTVSVQDNNGCTATASTSISQPAVMTITHDSVPASLGCSGAAGVNMSGGTSPYTYLWSPGGHTNDTINGLCAGTYTCTVTDNNGCSQSTYITIINCVNNYNEPICIITLDTATNNCELIWGRTNSPPSGGYGQYNIYKDTNNTDVLVHSQPLNVLSEYTDPTSNPSLGAVSYKISTVDSCGESALSPVHTSIYLTTTAGINVYILNWTAYVGFTPLRYVIFRGPSLSTLTPIDSVPNSVLTYHDTLPPLGSYYVLEAVSPNGPCIPSAHKAIKTPISLLSGSFSNGFNTAILGVINIWNDINNLNIYPNPGNGMFTLSYLMKQSDNVQISIINELGQIVYMEQKHTNAGLNTEQLNLENIAQGIYSIRLQTNTGITVRKLIKIN